MWYLVTLFLALPAFAANMAPVIAAHQKWLMRYATPINEKQLGTHKTWRGLIVAIIAATIVALLEYAFYSPSAHLWINFLLFGILSGFGAMVGDAAKSYIKRKVGIAPGKPFIPFDYFDYIIGVVLFTYPLYQWSFDQVIFLILFVCIANPAINVIGYMLGVKKTYW
jgi:CDP-2,3-bis-(O-geranylgeranyl)-sn-glycerol synthase